MTSTCPLATSKAAARSEPPVWQTSNAGQATAIRSKGRAAEHAPLTSPQEPPARQEGVAGRACSASAASASPSGKQDRPAAPINPEGMASSATPAQARPKLRGEPAALPPRRAHRAVDLPVVRELHL